jgi:hypothetical protein
MNNKINVHNSQFLELRGKQVHVKMPADKPHKTDYVFNLCMIGECKFC